MGNRVTIELFTNSNRFGQEHLCFYGHWSGRDAIEAVKEVLATTSRIGDEDYLAAQIFHRFATKGQYDGDTGFGIRVGTNDDNWDDNPTVFVNLTNGQYSNGGDEWFTKDGEPINE